MSEAVLARIRREKIVAIVRGIPSEKIVPLARALTAGGVTCLEVTFDQTGPQGVEETLAALRALHAQEEGALCVGAGTVLTAGQARMAAEAGAEYILTPNVDESVIRETKRLGKVCIPGAFTATEIVRARQCGADIVKLFPAGLFGETYVRALRAPLRHIPMLAVGGVTAENCASFLRAGCVGVSAGGSLVSAKLVNEGRFDEITAAAAAYTAALRAAAEGGS